MVIFCVASCLWSKRFSRVPAFTGMTALQGDAGAHGLSRVERDACGAEDDPI
jgi:hypothetical protein